MNHTVSAAGTTIGQYLFDAKSHELFMSASDDRNPIHSDIITAAKCLTGKRIVHGIHSLLAALECWLEWHDEIPTQIKCEFHSPISVGDTAVFLQQKKTKIKVMVGDTCCATITITASQNKHQQSIATPESGTLFPRMTAKTGVDTVTALLACSHHVGMVCPGLYSLFSSLDVCIKNQYEHTAQFHLENIDDRFNLYTISVTGVIDGTITAFQRPAPVAPPSLADARTVVSPETFHGMRALIIGGSRGIGACTAKLLAAGGADVTLTWHHSNKEAAEIEAEINDWRPDSCRAIPFDITADEIHLLTTDISKINTVFYFATPQINKNPDREQQDLYHTVYVEGLAKLCAQLEKTSSEKIAVFLPSTVFIDEPNKHFSAYAAAKLAAEQLAECINKESDNIHIYSYRLPAMQTDQTAAPGSRQLPPVLASILPFLSAFYEIVCMK